MLPLAWAVSLGGLSGLLTAGVGSRIVMRLIALANPATEGTATDSRAVVGDFTLDGTIELLILGTVAGMFGGPLYLGLRRWLPVPSRWRGLAFGVLTLLTIGLVLFDPSNADFQIFEPVVLVVGLFSGLFLANGLLIAGLLDRFHPEPAYAPRPTASRVAASRVAAVSLAVVCLLGTFGFVGGTLGLMEDEGTCLQAAGGGNGCAVLRDP